MNPILKIALINPSLPAPAYATPGSNALDLCANLEAPVTVTSKEVVTIGTGVKVSIPEGYAGVLLPRSGLGSKNGLSLANTVGLIDSDYRGEIIAKVILKDGFPDLVITPGMRFVQLCVVVAPQCDLLFCDESELDVTARGDSGFGASGQ